MFGGLDICSLEAVVAKDGQEVIIEVNDCALNLMGETQEEDRKQISEMVLKQMELQCVPIHTNGVVEENPAEKSSEGDLMGGQEVKDGDKTGKSLPGPLQRGPQRNSQGGEFYLKPTMNHSLTSRAK